jgi:hypothetical protein
MRLINLFGSSLAIAAIAFGSPLLEERQVNICKEVDFIVTILKLEKATSFCSSFLGIKTATAFTTTTPVTLTTLVLPGPTVTSYTVTGTEYVNEFPFA